MPSAAPADAATSRMLVPIAISITPGWLTPPPTVTRALPRVTPDPSSRYQPSPNLAMRATWARVSTFWTSVGRPSTPRSNGRGGTVVGRASPASM